MAHFRWLKFNAVGGIGVAVQLATLAFFHYAIANLTAVATCSIVNFLFSNRFVFESQPLA